MKKNNLLILAPHPDDEVLGCGGIIRKYSSSKNVYIVVATKGSEKMYSADKIKNIRMESKKAHNILGVKETVFFDFPAPFLDTISIAEISNSIHKIIIKLEVDTLFLPHMGDIHNDHKVIFEAGLVAARPVNNCPVMNIYAYETISETEWSAPFQCQAFIPTHFEDISNEYDFKIQAISCYKSQIKEFPNSRSKENIEALAIHRGATVGYKYAEAFMTIRTLR